MIESFHAAAATHVGLHRDVNEDAVFVGRRLVVVADGLGGHHAGDVASRLAAGRLAELDARPLTADAVAQAVLAANDDLLHYAMQHPESAGLGTTIAGVGLADVAGVAHWIVFSVGDSRVYRFADRELSQATVDHSEATELLLGGLVSDPGAVTAAERSVITRALGSDPAPQLDLWLLPATSQERFLLCSDGLWSEVDDEHLSDVLLRFADADTTCADLVDLALRAGGSDNISVIVVDGAPAPVPGVERTQPRRQPQPTAGVAP